MRRPGSFIGVGDGMRWLRFADYQLTVAEADAHRIGAAEAHSRFPPAPMTVGFGAVGSSSFSP